MLERGGGPSICWTRASCIAALVAGSVTCLLLGMLAGVMAAGGHPDDVIPALGPAPAQAQVQTTQPRRHVRWRTRTVTVAGDAPPASTLTVREPASTVTRTVTVVSTETVTDPGTTPGTTDPTP
jgi:hypothetical protein